MTKQVGKIVLLDQKFDTEFGELVIKVYADELIGDITKYQRMLKTSRGIPFDLSTVNSVDALAVLAGQQMDWASPEEIVEITRNHYESLDNDARSHAMILALAKHTDKLKFDVTPWTEEPAGEDWEFNLPMPVYNLNNPLERRLRQISMMMDSSNEVRLEIAKAMNTMFIEAERRSRELDDDGFRAGRSGGDVSAKPVSGGGKSKRGSTPGLALVLESDGSALSESPGDNA